MVFGVGIDIIEVGRVEEKVARTEGLKARIFTPREIAYCESKHRPALHYAARFAAKEAFLKAMGTGWTGGLSFADIEVVDNDLGRPEIFVHGGVAGFCAENSIVRMAVSLTHIRDLAQAMVILEKA